MIPTTIMISSRVKAWSDRFPPARPLAREAFRSRRAEVTAAASRSRAVAAAAS